MDQFLALWLLLSFGLGFMMISFWTVMGLRSLLKAQMVKGSYIMGVGGLRCIISSDTLQNNPQLCFFPGWQIEIREDFVDETFREDPSTSRFYYYLHHLGQP